MRRSEIVSSKDFLRELDENETNLIEKTIIRFAESQVKSAVADLGTSNIIHKLSRLDDGTHIGAGRLRIGYTFLPGDFIVCYLLFPDGSLFCGASHRSIKDKPNPIKGRILALQRLISSNTGGLNLIETVKGVDRTVNYT